MAREDRNPRQRLDPDTRRREILRAAEAAFAQTRYELVQVGAVAAAAGASEALVFKYFGSKAQLYAAVMQAAIDDLSARRHAALAELVGGVPVRDRVRAELIVYLDHLASAPGRVGPLAGLADEPPIAAALRRQARADYIAALRGLLGVHGWPRHEYAVWGYLGFLDGVCAHWVARGATPAERDPLIEAALGALQGALGDWAT